ncbi:hypothetical protein DICVIV_03993 [Dictyocaulus viviparus]|uniref:Amidinotransferase n=1 Tax=Dictyocaulus viviparus TaxID=29172 RepID=A0A0D8Y157_DICVI|nr:hypothetical protein DICVIV_03993 [Dictyocaulus viviparus]
MTTARSGKQITRDKSFKKSSEGDKVQYVLWRYYEKLPFPLSRIEELLEHYGFKTHFVPMSEFLKSGGSAKCLTLRLN